MYTTPKILNNMRSNMSTTGITLHCYIAPTISILYLHTMSRKLITIVPLKREGIFGFDLIGLIS